MSRIAKIQEKYELAKSNFKEGNTKLSVSPYYWSIYENGRVKESEIPSQSLADNPKYIISAFVHHYQYYGNRRDAKIICYRNLDEGYYSNIPLTKWTLTEISLFSCTLVEAAKFELNTDYNQCFEFKFNDGIAFKSMQMFWDFARALDLSCNTVAEAKLFFDYYLKKLALNNLELSLADFIEQLAEQKDLNKRYAELLDRISELVDKPQ